MANTTNTRHTCERFMTDEEYKAERERVNNERMERNETRLNFLLTALEVSATTTQHLMEYFDSLFQDHMVERNWRQARKKAANDIRQCAERMRTLYQYSFMQDQNIVHTKRGTQAYDVAAYEMHEDDARMAALKLLYDVDRCWQLPERDRQILECYKAMPDNGSFDEIDYRHFTKR